MRAGKEWDRSPAGRGSQSGREGEVGVGGAEGRGLPQRGRGCVSREPGRAGRGGSASPPALWASRRWGRDTPEPRPRARSGPGSDPGALRESLARGAALLLVHPAQLRPGQEVVGAVGDRGGLVPLCRLRRSGRWVLRDREQVWRGWGRGNEGDALTCTVPSQDAPLAPTPPE